MIDRIVRHADAITLRAPTGSNTPVSPHCPPLESREHGTRDAQHVAYISTMADSSDRRNDDVNDVASPKTSVEVFQPESCVVWCSAWSR
jgi:hypothetical protein